MLIVYFIEKKKIKRNKRVFIDMLLSLYILIYINIYELQF
jgi:hypothetical protein